MRKRQRKIDTFGLLDRERYLVVQANDISKILGNLKTIEHKVLDYCVSFITKTNKGDETFRSSISEFLKQFGMSDGGGNYRIIAEAFSVLHKKTPLTLHRNENGVTSIRMVYLFEEIYIDESGVIEWTFSKAIRPLLFELMSNYYSFRLSDVSNIKSKYTHVLMKLWKASYNRHVSPNYTSISGSVEEWKEWFLEDKADYNSWTSGRFNQKVLTVAMRELEEKQNVTTELISQKKGRRIIGWEMIIKDLTVGR